MIESVQLPLYEPMYQNGQLTPTWVAFFDRIAKLVIGQRENVDLSDLAALAATLPNSAILGQMSLEQVESSLVQTTIEQQQAIQAVKAVLTAQCQVDAVDTPIMQVITP